MFLSDARECLSDPSIIRSTNGPLFEALTCPHPCDCGQFAADWIVICHRLMRQTTFATQRTCGLAYFSSRQAHCSIQLIPEGKWAFSADWHTVASAAPVCCRWGCMWQNAFWPAGVVACWKAACDFPPGSMPHLHVITPYISRAGCYCGSASYRPVKQTRHVVSAAVHGNCPGNWI